MDNIPKIERDWNMKWTERLTLWFVRGFLHRALRDMGLRTWLFGTFWDEYRAAYPEDNIPTAVDGMVNFMIRYSETAEPYSYQKGQEFNITIDKETTENQEYKARQRKQEVLDSLTPEKRHLLGLPKNA
jgi:hypothetical protein